MREVAPAPRPEQRNARRMDQHRRMRGRTQYRLDDRLGELLRRGGLPGHSLEPGCGAGKLLDGQERGPNVVLLRAGELHVMGELVDQRGPQVRRSAGDADRDQSAAGVVRPAAVELPGSLDRDGGEAASAGGERLDELLPR